MSSASRLQAESTTRLTGAEHDDLWLLSEDYEQWMTQSISELLGLDLAQSLVDLGGGSGRFSSLLACSNPHLQEVFCVDPDPGMLMAAETRKGIIPKCMSADEYVASQSPGTVERLLLKEVLHHIGSRLQFWQQVGECMTGAGKALVVTRPQMPGFPFCDQGIASFCMSQPGIDTLIREIEAAGLHAELSVRSYALSIAATRWYSMLRHRFSSNLHQLSDRQIENGIQQLRKRYGDGTIDFQDTLFFLIVYRRIHDRHHV